MSRSRSALRRSVFVAVLFLFALARVALAGELCAAGSGGCVPGGISGHAHDHGQHGQVCALQTASPQHAGTPAPSHANLYAAAPGLDVGLSVPPRAETPSPLYVGPAADAASLLVTSGRLRL